MAALLSALISSMTSIFNSSSTVFTMDLWRRCRPQASEREKMVVSRLWILFLIVVSIVWLPVLQIVKGSQFWTYTQSIWSFFVPPIVMTFLFGIFWPRTTEQVNLTALVADNKLIHNNVVRSKQLRYPRMSYWRSTLCRRRPA